MALHRRKVTTDAAGTIFPARLRRRSKEAVHIRTVPIPLWVKRVVDSWTESSPITTGRVFRAINKAGRIWGRHRSRVSVPVGQRFPQAYSWAEALFRRTRPTRNLGTSQALLRLECR